MKKSFFKEYYLYRLRNMRGFFIASCILNLLNLPLFMVCVLIFTSTNAVNMSGSSDMSIMFNYYGSFTFLYIALSVLPALLIVGFLIPVTTKKHCYRKDYADTIGTLPLTHNQQYLADVLSELTVYVAPLIVCSVFSVIVSLAMGVSSFDSNTAFNIFETTGMYLLCCVGIIAFSEMISQLCGKLSSAVVYSAVLGVAVPLTVFFFVREISDSAVGLSRTDVALEYCSAIPPFGNLISHYISLFYGGSYDILEFGRSAGSVIVFVILTALCFVIGYLASKSRKAELIALKAFMHKITAYAVASILAMAAMSVSIASIIDRKGKFTLPYVILTLCIAFAVFIIVTLIHERKSVKIGKSLISFAAVSAAALAVILVGRATHGFGAEDYLPSKNSVEEIEIRNSSLVVSQMLSYTDENAISALIDEHQKLLNNKEKFSSKSGTSLKITYKLKSGKEISRCYYADEAYYKDYSAAMLSLPTSGNNLFRALTDDDVEILVEVDLERSTYDNDKGGYYTDYETYFVKSDRTDEFKTLFYNEITKNIAKEKADYYANITITATLPDGSQERLYYNTTTDFTATNAFLDNPDNLTQSVQSSNEAYTIDDYFKITLNYGESHLTATFSPSSASRIPDELLNLITSNKMPYEHSEQSELFEITTSDGCILYIRKADEEQAVKLFFEAVGNNQYGINR